MLRRFIHVAVTPAVILYRKESNTMDINGLIEPFQQFSEHVQGIGDHAGQAPTDGMEAPQGGAPADAPSDAPTDAPTDGGSEGSADAPSEAPADAPEGEAPEGEAPTDGSSEGSTDAPSEAPADAPEGEAPEGEAPEGDEQAESSIAGSL